MIDFQKAIDDYNRSTQWQRYPKANEFYPSEVSGCLRQAVRNRMRLVTFDNNALRNFAIGNMFHRYIQQQVGQGFIGKPVEFEKRMHFEHGKYLFTGHIDAYDGEYVYDFKTTKNIEWSTKYNMQTSYRYQTSLYVHGSKSKGAFIIYIDKRTLEVCPKEVKLIPMETIVEFCDKVKDAELEYLTSKILPKKDSCYACKCEKSGDEDGK